MKYPKILLAGKVFSTKAGAAQIEADAQKEFDALFGQDTMKVQITKIADKEWTVRIDRVYPESEQYEAPRASWKGETEIYYKDAFILAGNQGQEVVSFGMMPYAGYFRYYLADSMFLYHWNAAAKELGFTKIKTVRFNSAPDYFEATMQF